MQMQNESAPPEPLYLLPANKRQQAHNGLKLRLWLQFQDPSQLALWLNEPPGDMPRSAAKGKSETEAGAGAGVGARTNAQAKQHH